MVRCDVPSFPEPLPFAHSITPVWQQLHLQMGERNGTLGLCSPHANFLSGSATAKSHRIKRNLLLLRKLSPRRHLPNQPTEARTLTTRTARAPRGLSLRLLLLQCRNKLPIHAEMRSAYFSFSFSLPPSFAHAVQQPSSSRRNLPPSPAHNNQPPESFLQRAALRQR